MFKYAILLTGIMLFVPLVVRRVLASKTMSQVDPAYAAKIVMKELALYPQLQRLATLPSVDERIVRRQEVKDFVRHARGILFRRYGVFLSTRVHRREDILQNLRSASPQNVRRLCDEVLLLHASSRERLEEYPHLYKKIFSITGKPLRLLDVGSGMNPVSFPSMELDHIEYTAVELNKKDCSFLEAFFRELRRFYPHLTFHALHLDISESQSPHKLRSLGTFDVCFLFKMSDVVEEKGHTHFERLVTAIRASFLVVSFPTRTLSDKKMRQPRRRWFEVMAGRCGFTLTSFETSRELFYVLKRSS